MTSPATLVFVLDGQVAVRGDQHNEFDLAGSAAAEIVLSNDERILVTVGGDYDTLTIPADSTLTLFRGQPDVATRDLPATWAGSQTPITSIPGRTDVIGLPPGVKVTDVIVPDDTPATDDEAPATDGEAPATDGEAPATDGEAPAPKRARRG